MTISPKSNLLCLVQGTRFLARRPYTVLALSLLGTALATLAPWVQLRAGIADTLEITPALLGVAVLPLELFFIPRLLMETDAEAGGNPLNAAADWKVRFEERWLKTFVAKMLLGMVVGLGLQPLIFPAIMALLAFGWVPLRVLLKGEGLLDAIKGSLRMTAQGWRHMVATGAALALAYLAVVTVLGLAQEHFLPHPTLWQRVTHPAIWVQNYVAILFSLWMSACLLALFRSLDQASDPAL